jgi:hypothetical protein
MSINSIIPSYRYFRITFWTKLCVPHHFYPNKSFYRYQDRMSLGNIQIGKNEKEATPQKNNVIQN